MKTLIAVATLLLCAGTLLAQTSATDVAPLACGKEAVKTDADVLEASTEPHQAPAGKALIVFIEDFRADRPRHKCLGCSFPVSYGIDGNWAAATKGFSHTSIILEPGSHHLCGQVRKAKDEMPMFLNLDAKAGEIYYVIAIPQYESTTTSNGSTLTTWIRGSTWHHYQKQRRSD